MLKLIIKIFFLSVIFLRNGLCLTSNEEILFSCSDIINYSQNKLGTNNTSLLLQKFALNQLELAAKKIQYTEELEVIQSELKEVSNDLSKIKTAKPATFSTLLSATSSNLEIFSANKKWKENFPTTESLSERDKSWDNFSFNLLLQFVEIYSYHDTTLLLASKSLQQAYLLISESPNKENYEIFKKTMNSFIDQISNNLFSSLTMGNDPAAILCTDDETSFLTQISCKNLSAPNLLEVVEGDVEDLTAILSENNINEKINSVLGNTIIHKVNYPKNEKEEYCKRDPDLMSYIVIHHTETDMDQTPLQINQSHLNKPGYYMVGYNYLVSMDYQGATEDSPKIFEGRPLEIQGAHASKYNKIPIKDLNEEDYKGKYLLCGNDVSGFSGEKVWNMAKKEGGLSGNFLGVGISIIGNFVPITYRMVGGTRVPSTNLTTEELTPTKPLIEKLGKLVCKLQKKNPNLKKIVSHGYFRTTDCPGKLRQVLSEIAAVANSLGCQFSSDSSTVDDRKNQ